MGCDPKLLKGFAALVVWFVHRTRRLRASRAFDPRDSRHWTECAAVPTALRSQVFTRFGWYNVRHPYRVSFPEESDVFKTFGLGLKMPPGASDVATRIAVTCGSFKEAAESLNIFGCERISVSKLRKETLRVGEIALAKLRSPQKDTRQYSKLDLRTPSNSPTLPSYPWHNEKSWEQSPHTHS